MPRRDDFKPCSAAVEVIADVGELVSARGWVYWFAIDGSIARRMGGSAEEWTSEELNKLDRRTWKIIDDVAFADFNVDHVVVGPELVLSLETKWSSSPVRLDRRGWVHRSHLGQSKSAAGRIQRLLKSRGVERRVVPMLMYWGRGARSLPQDVTWSDDVAVVPGKQASKLIERLELSRRSIESDYPAYRALREYVEKHEETTRA